MPVRALSVTFVGELGWELYCPTEYGAEFWSTLWGAGQEHGLVACGYKAIDTMRLEKGYRVWASDITPDETPFEAGLGFCVKIDSRVRRLGAAGGAREPAAPEKRLRCLVLVGPALGRAGQRARQGRRSGRRPRDQRRLRLHASSDRSPMPTSRRDVEFGTAVEMDIFGRWVSGEVSKEPLLDPKGERVRA